MRAGGNRAHARPPGSAPRRDYWAEAPIIRGLRVAPGRVLSFSRYPPVSSMPPESDLPVPSPTVEVPEEDAAPGFADLGLSEPVLHGA